METPADVLIHNSLLGLKGEKGKLFQIGHSHYEVEYDFGGNVHRVLLPIGQTVLIAGDPVEDVEPLEVEEPLEAVRTRP